MVYAVLEASIETEDRLLHRLAYQVAGIMMSSGNFKKNTSAEEIVNSVYAPIIDRDTSDAPAKPKREELSKDEAAQFVRDLANRIST